MKIALVSPYDFAYTGGVNVHICHLREQFTGMGHEVKVIAPCSQHRRMPNDGGLVFLGRPFALRTAGSIVRTPVSPWLYFSHKVKGVLDRERFDVIHVHEPLFPPLCCAVMHYSQGSIMVGTFHAYRGKSWGYWFWKPICLGRWFNKLNGRIAVSQAALKFASHYFPADYEIIPNGIDLKRFSADVAPAGEFCDGKLNILFVGRLEKGGQREGLTYLLGAYKRVKGDFPQSRLIVVAPNDKLRRSYERIAERERLEDVVFIGYVPNESLPPYYKTADIFCAPATGRESFGIILLEAMAMGKPIVASNIEGYSEVISHGAEGLLVKPKDEEALALALSQLLQDKQLRERMGALGRRKAEDYSWERIAHRVMDHYHRCFNLPQASLG